MNQKPLKTHLLTHFKGAKSVKCLMTGRTAKYVATRIDFNPKHKNMIFMDVDNYASVAIWTNQKGYYKQGYAEIIE